MFAEILYYIMLNTYDMRQFGLNILQKIPMIVDYCRCQLAQMLVLAAHAYLKRKVTASHPGLFRHSLKFDGRSDWRFWVWVGVWNRGGLRGEIELCEELREKLNVRLRGHGSWMFSCGGLEMQT